MHCDKQFTTLLKNQQGKNVFLNEGQGGGILTSKIVPSQGPLNGGCHEI